VRSISSRTRAVVGGAELAEEERGLGFGVRQARRRKPARRRERRAAAAAIAHGPGSLWACRACWHIWVQKQLTFSRFVLNFFFKRSQVFANLELQRVALLL
jgi:hypothetical protein